MTKPAATIKKQQEEKAGNDDSFDLNEDPLLKDKKSDKQMHDAAMAAIQAMKQRSTADKMGEKIYFSGKAYTIERTKTEKDVK